MSRIQEAAANKIHSCAWCTDYNLANNLPSALFSLNGNGSLYFETVDISTHDLTNT